MTRSEAKEFLITLGVEEPTDEAISNYLNSINGEANKAKETSSRLKELEAELAEKNAKLDEIEASNLSEIEKANNAVKKANDRIAELEKASRIANLKSDAQTKFNISAEQVEKVINADGELDFDALSEIIKEKEVASANAKEQELANGASNPSGGNGGTNNTDTKTEAQKIAETIGKQMSSNNDASKSIIESYM